MKKRVGHWRRSDVLLKILKISKILKASKASKNFYDRRVALALCVCFLVVSNLSAVLAFVYEHEHDHEGECCSACEQIIASQDFLRRFVTGPLSDGTEWKVGVVVTAPRLFYSWIHFPTLTTLKMRMNS